MRADLTNGGEIRIQAFNVAHVLRRCPACHAPHPLARNPPIDQDHCPDCGHANGEDFVRDVDAVLTDGAFRAAGPIWGWLARLLLRIAAALNALAERISP